MDRTLKHGLAATAALLALACGPALVSAQAPPEPIPYTSSGNADFDAWRDQFSNRALALGRDRQVVDRLLTGIRPDDRVIELDRRQPEFVAPVWDYVTNRVTENRITSG